MKHLIPAAIACLVISANPAPQGPRHQVVAKSIDYRFELTPEFDADLKRSRKIERRSWLELEAEIDVETLAENKFIPELTATWHVVLDNAFEKPNRPRHVRLKGSVTYLNLRAHQKTIKLVAYVHPDTLEMLTGKERPGVSDIRSVAVEFLGPDVAQNGAHKLALSIATGEKKDKRWWETWQQKTIDESIVSLNKTPFLPLWADQFPQVKE